MTTSTTPSRAKGRPPGSKNSFPYRVEKPTTASVSTLLSGSDPRFARLLEALAGGSFLSSACAYARLPYGTINAWLGKAKEGSKSPALQRFYEEVYAAIGTAAVLTEGEYRVESKKDWLTRGPRRLISDEWNEVGPNSPAVPAASNNPATVIVLQQQTASQALQELINAGVLSLSQPAPAVPPASKVIDAK